MSYLTAFMLLAAAQVELPPVPREFRAAWVATVDNIDWPSKRTLTTEQQKAELVKLLDMAQGMKLNAIVFQVRPSADALYHSRIEPWSEYLTNLQGRAPQPFYDPLEFAVQESHRRGLELHVWFNPYRAKHPAQKGPVALNHIARTHPQDVKTYGTMLWMDPGSKFVQQRSLEVIEDVVKRYDIDGVHIDDYFYPYPVGGQDFPDAASYAAYRQAGGKLAKADWRRKNVDDFVQALYGRIKKNKKWVKFGISPFGIYRPGIPAGIAAGIDQYDQLYADAQKWLVEGWCDYYSPQLYWPIAQKPQSYPVLLDWWVKQNPKGRHLWIGNFTSRTNPKDGNWKAKEVVEQVGLTRRSAASGNIHFSIKALANNWNGVRDALRALYSQDALPPASPWLDSVPPAPPKLERFGDGTYTWTNTGGEKPMWWAVWRRYGDQWTVQVRPAGATSMAAPAMSSAGELNLFAVSSVDRSGNASIPTRLVPPRP